MEGKESPSEAEVTPEESAEVKKTVTQLRSDYNLNSDEVTRLTQFKKDKKLLKAVDKVGIMDDVDQVSDAVEKVIADSDSSYD